MNSIWNAFFLGELWSSIGKSPIIRAAQLMLFFGYGAPFLYGFFFLMIARGDNIIYWAAITPGSTMGVMLRTAVDTAGAAALNDEGKPLIYPDADIEQVGTGITLKDIEKKKEKAE